MNTVTIEVPRLWLKLLFQEIPAGTGKARYRKKGELDPHPYRDDQRGLTATYDDGLVVTLYLASGDTNYWVWLHIEDGDNVVFSLPDALHQLREGPMDLRGADIPNRDVIIKFVGPAVRAKCTLTIDVEYDPCATEPEALASAIDGIFQNAFSTPGILDEYGALSFGMLSVQEQEE